jgi:hypothetical protein
MKKLLTYLFVGLLALRIVIWFADNKLKDNLNSTFETTDNRQSHIDWLKSWTKIWIDEEDKFQADSDGFTRAIHNVSYPITEQQKTNLGLT